MVEVLKTLNNFVQATPVFALLLLLSQWPGAPERQSKVPSTMRRPSILGTSLAMAVGSASSVTAAATVLVPKFTSVTNGLLSGLFSETLSQEVRLPVALTQETNTSFDLKVYDSVRTAVKSPVIVSFLLVTFIFSSPTTNYPVYSFCEMGNPDELVCTGRTVSRRPGSTNDIPLIRVSTVNRQRKELLADLALLMGVAPLDNPQDVRYVRRSFVFVYRDGWKEE